MIFVDSGHLIALLEPRDELHPRSAEWIGALSERLLTTDYVIWELVNYFSAPADRLKVHEAVDEILSNPDWEVVRATAKLFADGLNFHRRVTDKAWSLTDCISFLVMRERGITRALTHDHHFEQAGFEALLRRDPP